MIIGVVRSHEVFRTGEALRLVAGDMDAGLAETLDLFTGRVRTLLIERWPDCSDGFVDWITRRAWVVHTVRRLRLLVTPSMLALILRVTEREPGDAAGALAAEAKRAWRRLTENPLPTYPS